MSTAGAMGPAALERVQAILADLGREPQWLPGGRGIVAWIAGRRVVVVALGITTEAG